MSEEANILVGDMVYLLRVLGYANSAERFAERWEALGGEVDLIEDDVEDLD